LARPHARDRILMVTAIRVIFDGKTFVPQQPVSLAAQSEALVLVENNDKVAQQQLDDGVRAYYQGGSDAEDESWAKATSAESRRAWDED
jgi:hypothetical protein